MGVDAQAVAADLIGRLRLEATEHTVATVVSVLEAHGIANPAPEAPGAAPPTPDAAASSPAEVPATSPDAAQVTAEAPAPDAAPPAPEAPQAAADAGTEATTTAPDPGTVHSVVSTVLEHLAPLTSRLSALADRLEGHPPA